MTQTQNETKSANIDSGSNGGGDSRNPAIDQLLSEAQSYLFNRTNNLVGSLGERVTGTIGKLDSVDGGALKQGVKSLAGGASPAKAGLAAGGKQLKDKVGGLFGGDKKKSGAGKEVKATNINEQIDIGLPVSVVYNQWTQFEEFGSFTKGVQSVSQKDETTTEWKAKIALSTRSWKSTITDQVPDDRIVWESEGAKGTVNGVVTFHELAPNLTRVIVELEYTPKGFMEKTGNLWRAQGRRVRLDLKHFRRFVMMRGEETGAWRGKIADSEVKSSERGSGRNGNRGSSGRSGSKSSSSGSSSSSSSSSSRQRKSTAARRSTASKGGSNGGTSRSRSSQGKKETTSSGGRR